MAIVPSRARRIQELLGGLGSAKAAERDSAVARLTLLGPRAVGPLLGALPASSARFRQAALEVLDRLRDPRALPEVVALAQDRDPEVALRAVRLAEAYPEPRTAQALARVLASGPPEGRGAAARSLARLHGAGVVEALEPLLETLLDEDEDEELRLDILGDLARREPSLDTRTLPPVLKRLRGSRVPALAARAEALLRRGGKGEQGGDTLAHLLDRVADPALRPGEAEPLVKALARLAADDVDALHGALERAREPLPVRVLADALGRVGRTASIPPLKRALERLGYEGGGALPEQEAGARARAKAHVHAALAALDSRIALFDLRQMLRAPPSRAAALLLGAAATVGDGSLAPALARLATERPEQREACALAFAAIARRERLRRTSSVLKTVRSQDRATLESFWAKARATPGGGKRPR